jgi:mannose-1-phosphate guanylyltransferase / mannose-6-phosphate isomerase
MKQPLIIPIILSGGAGSRLWPLSRAARPKQFLKFGSEHTLFQNTVLRCKSAIFDRRPIVVSGESQRFLVAEDLLEIGLAADIVLEPMRRDSCAAIAAGCLVALRRSPDAMVLVLSADHIISEQHEFDDAVASASIDAAAGFLTTFGVKPHSPATGFGYIKPGEQLRSGGAFKIEKFVEKPNLETANEYVRDGYFWNSGNFLFRAASFIEELKRYAPLVFSAMELAIEKAQSDVDFIRLNSEEFARSPQISVDYAVMEKTERAAVFPVQYSWNDIGSWDAVFDTLTKDAFANAIAGEGFVLDGNNNMVHSLKRFTALVGVDDLIVVTVDDAVLVTKRGKAEMLKTLIGTLKTRNPKLSE